MLRSITLHFYFSYGIGLIFETTARYNAWGAERGTKRMPSEPFNDWGGGGDVTNLSPFWEGTARKKALPGTYLTNPLVKCDEFGASLPAM